MANNSAILGLMMCGIWFLFFYLANLGTVNYLGFFGFDSSELPIVTIYALYIPVFIGFMKKATDFVTGKEICNPDTRAVRFNIHGYSGNICSWHSAGAGGGSGRRRIHMPDTRISVHICGSNDSRTYYRKKK